MALPKCPSCSVKHPWLMNKSHMVNELVWTCNECGSKFRSEYTDGELIETRSI